MSSLKYFLLLALLCSLCFAGMPKKKTSIKDRGLVVGKDIGCTNIIRYHNDISPSLRQKKVFSGTTLGFVTPWNNHGYDIAKELNAKFTYISPVWLQLQPTPGMPFLRGTHDIDQGWIEEVRSVKKGTPPLIVPRILFEGWSQEAYATMGTNSKLFDSIVTLIVTECQNHGFDGFVLDFSYLQFSGLDGIVNRLVKAIGNGLHNNNKKLILVIPPFVPQYSLFSAEDYQTLYDSVDLFMMMTYDYSSGRKSAEGGPSAPISWMTQSVLNLIPPSQRANVNHRDHKILLGLNFYGTTYCSEGSSNILGKDFIELLETYHPTVKWNSEYSEHYINYNHEDIDWVAYYPTLKYIDDRLELAKSLDVGIGIWELGQGLDYFFDLF